MSLVIADTTPVTYLVFRFEEALFQAALARDAQHKRGDDKR